MWRKSTCFAHRSLEDPPQSGLDSQLLDQLLNNTQTKKAYTNQYTYNIHHKQESIQLYHLVILNNKVWQMYAFMKESLV
jgi:hypothetical protein